jgi:hypothetical protein
MAIEFDKLISLVREDMVLFTEFKIYKELINFMLSKRWYVRAHKVNSILKMKWECLYVLI